MSCTPSLLWLPLAAFLLSVLIHALALKEFPKMKLLDFPQRYGHDRDPIPYPTGIITVLIFVGFFSFIAPWTKQSAGLILSIFALALISFTDDRHLRLPASFRLVMQALLAFLIFATGTRIYTLTNPLDGIIGESIIKLDTKDIITKAFGPLPLWSGVFTVFWILLTTNALNWFDGVPGQVSVLSLIGFLTIGFLSISTRVDQPELALLAFILAGLAASGLLFDFPPAKVLMGDTGAMFLGLMLGVLTIYSGGKVATAFLVLGVPLIDLFLVIARRILKKKSIFEGAQKNEHLHHRLLECGWSERKVIALTVILGSSFGITALFLSTRGKFFAALILLVIMISLSLYTERRKES